MYAAILQFFKRKDSHANWETSRTAVAEESNRSNLSRMRVYRLGTANSRNSTISNDVRAAPSRCHPGLGLRHLRQTKKPSILR